MRVKFDVRPSKLSGFDWYWPWDAMYRYAVPAGESPELYEGQWVGEQEVEFTSPPFPEGHLGRLWALSRADPLEAITLAIQVTHNDGLSLGAPGRDCMPNREVYPWMRKEAEEILDLARAAILREVHRSLQAVVREALTTSPPAIPGIDDGVARELVAFERLCKAVDGLHRGEVPPPPEDPGEADELEQARLLGWVR
jgi:hypothetical protein